MDYLHDNPCLGFSSLLTYNGYNVINTMATEYNFAQSLERIDEVLHQQQTPEILDKVPVVDELEPNKTYIVNATVIYIKYDIINNPFLLGHPNKSDMIVQSYVTEAIAIARANSNCRDVIAVAGGILMVYNTYYKSNLNEALDDVARIRSMSMVVSKKANNVELPQIKVSIGIDFGVVSMIPVELNHNGLTQITWRGKIIDKVRDFASDKAGDVLVSRRIWHNLNEKNQSLFQPESSPEDTFRSHLVNIEMNSWLTM